MQFSTSERALLRSHAQVLQLMADRCEELINRRNPLSWQAAQLREFSYVYRSLAQQHLDQIAGVDEEKFAA